jgi:hypothetical protein
MKFFPGKSPMQMRREAEQGATPPSAPTPRPVDPASLPPLHSDNPDELRATADWLAHIAAGRIQVKR